MVVVVREVSLAAVLAGYCCPARDGKLATAGAWANSAEVAEVWRCQLAQYVVTVGIVGCCSLQPAVRI